MRAGFQTLLGAALIAGASLTLGQSVSAMPVAGTATLSNDKAEGVVPVYYRCGYYGCHHRYRAYYRPYGGYYRHYGYGYYRPYYAPRVGLGLGLGGFGLGLY